MNAEQLSQSEIDALVDGIKSPESESDYTKALSETAKKRRIELESAMRRYTDALANGWYSLEQHRADMHHYAHKCWLRNRGFSGRWDFRRWVVKQMKLKIEKSGTEHERQYWAAALENYKRKYFR